MGSALSAYLREISDQFDKVAVGYLLFVPDPCTLYEPSFRERSTYIIVWGSKLWPLVWSFLWVKVRGNKCVFLALDVCFSVKEVRWYTLSIMHYVWACNVMRAWIALSGQLFWSLLTSLVYNSQPKIKKNHPCWPAAHYSLEPAEYISSDPSNKTTNLALLSFSPFGLCFQELLAL